MHRLTGHARWRGLVDAGGVAHDAIAALGLDAGAHRFGGLCIAKADGRKTVQGLALHLDPRTGEFESVQIAVLFRQYAPGALGPFRRGKSTELDQMRSG